MARDGFSGIASRLAEIGHRFYMRGWVMGTSGNFSAVVSRQPFRLAITASSVHKGRLRAGGHPAMRRARRRRRPKAGTPTPLYGSSGKPSAETLLHIEIARRRGAGAVLHTHSVWTTVLSDLHAAAGGFTIEGYEMLKGLHGVRSHDHREWIPILANDQNMPRLAQRVGETLDSFTESHAFLLCRHGLYTWGDTLADAERHIEILEFLFEAIGRTRRRQSGCRQFNGL